ncbi:MAG: hypothetical protein SF182_02940 [Deltaproteobacteria bacterium]|nr:hypothetical protein [Deltaproteobacteria bacterium]
MHRVDVHQHIVPPTDPAWLRGGAVRRCAALKIILAHAGGFLPYASHRLAAPITAETVRFFTSQLDAYQPLDRAGHAAIERGNAEAPFPRFAATAGEGA